MLCHDEHIAHTEDARPLGRPPTLLAPANDTSSKTASGREVKFSPRSRWVP